MNLHAFNVGPTSAATTLLHPFLLMPPSVVGIVIAVFVLVFAAVMAVVVIHLPDTLASAAGCLQGGGARMSFPFVEFYARFIGSNGFGDCNLVDYI